MQDNTLPKGPEEQQNNSDTTKPPPITITPTNQVGEYTEVNAQPSMPATESVESLAETSIDNSPTTIQAPINEQSSTMPAPQVFTQPTVSSESVPAVGVTPEVPKKKSPKKLIIALAAAVAILLMGTAGVMAYLSTITTPTEHLQNAITTSAQTQSLQQVYSVESTVEGSEIKGNVTMQNDFSDPASPKSIGNFDIDVSVFGIAIKVKSEFICVSETECFIKYKDFTIPEELSTEKPAFLNQWLKFNPYDDASAQTADPFLLITGLNTVLGEVITGNITGNAQAEISKYATNGSTYTFTSSNEEQLDGKSAIKYDLALNPTEILELNKIVASQYNIQNPFKSSSDISQRVTVWVDKSTDRIVKVASEEDEIKSTVTYSKFNEKPEIKAPESYLNPEEYNAIL